MITRIRLGKVAVPLAMILAAPACQSPGRRTPATPPPSADAAPADGSWQFVILSDIHVFPSGSVAKRFRALIPRLVELKPRLVLVTGDSTNGNQGDRLSKAQVAKWWQAFHAALQPLADAGIPVLPIAGNHDWYTPAQRQGYSEAWGDLSRWRQGIALEGQPPLLYSFSVGQAHFTMLQVVDQGLPLETAEFLARDLAEARDARVRLAFGHVPLMSVMGRTSPSFLRDGGLALLAAGVDAYFAGHEHLVWDEEIPIPGAERRLRQVTVGTASATYTFPLSRETAARVGCAVGPGRGGCIMPFPRKGFCLEKGTRQQAARQSFTLVTVTSQGFDVEPQAVAEDGTFRPFYEPDCAGK